MKGYTDDMEVAAQWSAKAFDLMARHSDVPPLPANYALWFRYVSGQDKALNEEIDAELKEGRKLDERMSEDLHRRYVVEASLMKTTLDTGDKLGNEVDKILKLVQETIGDSTALSSAVRKAGDGLTSKSTPNDVRRVVEAIVGATVQMEKKSRELEERLTETKGELSTLKTNLSKARNEARTDGLTGVSNRKAFDEALSDAIRKANADGSPLCLVIGDIDHFKSFNDTWGHRTGDQVLRLVASCLKVGVRDTDTVARYGGEEFAIIMPGCTPETAEKLANAVREAVQSRELVKRSTGETLGRVTMSLGVAALRPGDSPASIIERSDACLYTAKRSGRNRVIAEGQTSTLTAKAS